MSAVAGRRPIHVGELADDELVRLARTGDEAAFAAIVHRYRAPLVGYCRRWLDAHRAEEVVQHTFMKAFLWLRDDDRPLALRPWLYRVAHNAALNALEKKGSDWEELDENYDGVPQPPQVAEQRARFLKVVDEIDALPERQREALLLNEFEGRCYADIASELGTSESGVRGLLRRARSQLRETAAALLFPFPVLRELVRADAGRGLQLDRAGEVIGSAGAAGGTVAAGGLTKIAAGVLAAGTIAGGGAAMKAERNGPPAPRADAAPAAGAKTGFAPAERVRRTLLTRVVADDPRPAPRHSSRGQERRSVAGGWLPAGGPHGGASPHGFVPRGDRPVAPGRIEPLEALPTLPTLPTVPLIPLTGGAEEKPADEDSAPGSSEQGQPAESASPPGEGEQADASTPEESSAPKDERTTRLGPPLPRSS